MIMELGLIHYFAILFFALLIAFISTPIFKIIAIKLKLYDYPGGRKLQENPVAYLGGLAILTPITFGSTIFLFSSNTISLKQELFLGLIIPGVLIAFVGLLDDIWQLPPWPRFLSQTIVGVITSFMLYLSGSGVMLFKNEIINSTVTIVWVVSLMNAFNFIDNMDGLATSISIISALSLFYFAYYNNQYLLASFSIAILASCLGFLFWNKSPASIYLGDAGSLYLGFLLAAISIRLDMSVKNTSLSAVILILIFAVPILDITQVVVTRLIRGVSPFNGGRDHLSHLLLKLGLREKEVLFVLVLISIFCSTIAVILA